MRELCERIYKWKLYVYLGNVQAWTPIAEVNGSTERFYAASSASVTPWITKQAFYTETVRKLKVNPNIIRYIPSFFGRGNRQNVNERFIYPAPEFQCKKGDAGRFEVGNRSRNAEQKLFPYLRVVIIFYWTGCWWYLHEMLYDQRT